MLQRVEVDVTGGLAFMVQPSRRYAVLERLEASAMRLGVRVYAFGFGERALRLLVSGGTLAIGHLTRGLKVGAATQARAAGLSWSSEHSYVRHWAGTVFEGAAWCHRAGAVNGRVDALASPWSSHRDALGFRRAAFFDPKPLQRHINVPALQRACGGGVIPQPPRRPPQGMGRDLKRLMRVSAAVTGVLAPHRHCIPTFVHLAMTCGARRGDVGDALAVGERRIRQLLNQDAPGLLAAMASLTDERLMRVP